MHKRLRSYIVYDLREHKLLQINQRTNVHVPFKNESSTDFRENIILGCYNKVDETIVIETDGSFCTL